MTNKKRWIAPVLATVAAVGIGAGAAFAVPVPAAPSVALGCVGTVGGISRVLSHVYGDPSTFPGCPKGTFEIALQQGSIPAPVPSPTTPSPTPTPTTPSPTPSQTTPAACVETDNTLCGPYVYPAITGLSGKIIVGNDIWTTPAAGNSQTLTATDPGNWNVNASYPAGGTSVLAFPNTGQAVDWTPAGVPPLLSSWNTIVSSYSENLNANPGTVAESAYDIWLNNWANEVMIQGDFAGDAARPRCDKIGAVVASASFGGANGVPVQSWNLCQFGTELIWQLPTGVNQASGTVDILGMLTWLETHGYLPAASGLTDISFGFEICSTGGVPETFKLNSYSVTGN